MKASFFASVGLAIVLYVEVGCGQSHGPRAAASGAGAGASNDNTTRGRDAGATRSDAGSMDRADAGRTPAAGRSAGGAGSAAGRGGNAGSAATEPRIPCERTDADARGELELISLSLDCAEADGDVSSSRLTRDGRFVAFDSDAGDLVPNDMNGSSDGFLFDLETRELELISKKRGGQDPARGDSFLPVPSDDARYVAFTAYSFELTTQVPEDGLWIYLRDRKTQTTRRFSGSYACAYWVDMTGDGSVIVAEGYTRCDGGLEDGDYDSAFVYDVASGSTRRLGSEEKGEDNYRPAITRDGRFILWGTRPPMTRGAVTSQLRIHDRMTDTIETLPFNAFHYESTAISDSGQIVAFAHNQQVYRYDRERDELTLVSQTAMGEVGDAWSTEVSLSGDGRYLVFTSAATNLVPDDENGEGDILLYDAERETLDRISTAPDGTQADDDSKRPYISGDGTKISFASKARNLLPAAVSGNYQLYVRTLEPR